MFKQVNIGIIGGTGWMGKAIGDGLLKHSLPPQQLWISNSSNKNTYTVPIHFGIDSQTLIDSCDVIILATRPEQFAKLNLDANNKLVISIMARTGISFIQNHIKTERIIAAMPNVAAIYNESYTPWYASSAVMMQDKKIAQKIFECIGSQNEVSNEDQLNFFTALTGSSHAWLVYIADAFVRTGVAYGLGEEETEHAIRQVMKGMGHVVAHEKRNPQESLAFLTKDPNTTTFAGLQSFIDSKIGELIQKGIFASYNKACETK